MQSIKKKSKLNLISSENIDKRKSQQKRILKATYFVGNLPESEQ